VTPEGIALCQENISFDPERDREWAGAIRAVLKQFTDHLGHAPLHVGLSAPGLAARDRRSIAYLPNRLHGLEGLDWTAFLGLPAMVPVLNDAHAALIGENWLGAARGLRNVVLLTLGTGVGGAAIVDGHLLRGHTGKAGHLGHTSLDPNGAPDICNTPGSLEIMMGNDNVRERTEGRFATTHELIKAHESGDAFATRVWMRSVRALAAAIASFSNILDPEAIIIGGGIARSGETLFCPLRELVSRFEWKVCGHEVKLVPAQLGELAGAYGAAWNAFKPA
jgi:glucokinase